jgi:hypothetical protein
MQVSCPKCFSQIDVGEKPDDEEKVRVRCKTCGAGLMLKLNRRELRLSADIPVSRAELPAITDDILAIATASGSFPPIDPESAAAEGMESITGLSPWAAVIDDAAAVTPDVARGALKTLPRFRREPGRMGVLDGPLPWIFAGITKREATFVRDRLAELGASARCDVETVLLDGDGRPAPPAAPIETDSEESFDGEVDTAPHWEGGGAIEAVRTGFEPAPAAPPAPPAGMTGTVPRRSEPARASDPIVGKEGDVMLLTLESGVPWKEWKGLVSGHSLVPAARLDAASDRAALVAGALEEAKARVVAAARALDADVVLGLRVDQGPVPAGDDGLDWCVVVLGTAVSRGV